MGEKEDNLDIDAVKTEIKDLIDSRRWAALREVLADWQPIDIADLILTLEKSDRVLLFRALQRDQASLVFAELEPVDRDNLLKDLTDEETRRLLADMEPDDRTAVLEQIPGQLTQRLLNLLGPADLAEARLLLGFPEDSAGRLMTPDYVAVRRSWTIDRAITHIRKWGRDKETVSIIYVTDDQWNLLDALELQRFVLAEPDQRVEEIMDNTFIAISAYDDREEAVRLIDRYDLPALPVIDVDGVLVGVVTVDDVLDVARQEATEDFHKVGGVAPLENSYQETSVFSLYRKRIGWLLILVFVNLASSGIIAVFEETLTATIALAFFIPLLIDTGGNAGAQAATLMIRELATGDIDASDWFRIVIKELGDGFLLGMTMAVAAYGLGYWRGGPSVGLVIAITMLALLFVANIVGILLPFVLMRFKLDPAVASSPLITTVVDSMGLLIYFSVATALL
jgi:magnesium transporter